MAVLADNDRLEVWQEFMRDTELASETYGDMTKADLRAAVDALDQFFEDNKLTINAAIPQPARGQMTTKQKAKLIVWILRYRYLRGS